MTRAELDLGVEWAAQESWNPGSPHIHAALLPMQRMFGVTSFELG